MNEFIIDNSLSLEDRKEILILTLLSEFCKNNNLNQAFEYLSYQLYISGYISDKIFYSDNNVIYDLSKLYINKSDNSDIMSLITSPTNLIHKKNNISTLSRFKTQFRNISLLGSGGFGDVFKVKNIIDETEYAVKVVCMDNHLEESYIILREVRILSKLKHQNIIGYYSSWIGFDDVNTLDESSYLKLYIQMELCDKTLYDYLLNRDSIQHKINTKFLLEICEGLEYIHNRSIVHRDIKPKNIFIKDTTVKIGDFGLSRNLIANNNNSLTNTHEHIYTSNLGSFLYSAPELLNDNYYDKNVDIYSLGVIIFEMFSMFSTEMEKCKEFEKLKSEKTDEDNINKLVLECIKEDFTERIELTKIKSSLIII